MMLNVDLVKKSIGYHGPPLQKVWDGEHGDQSLINAGIPNPDYSVYTMRQKHFEFQDRAKRLKMHSLIAKKANELFAKDADTELNQSTKHNETVRSDVKSNATGGEWN